MKKKAQDTIETLTENKFYAECPCCEETILLSKANLFYLDEFNAKALEALATYKDGLDEQKKELKELKEKISARSEIGAGSVNIGFILEHMFPSLKEFPFCCDDCRSLFEPIDYLVFEGLANKGKVERLLWIEVKTGGSRLNKHEKEIKLLVENKELVWDIYKMEG